jgi:hypothetical protein
MAHLKKFELLPARFRVRFLPHRNSPQLAVGPRGIEAGPVCRLPARKTAVTRGLIRTGTLSY